MKKFWMPVMALGLILASCTTEVKTDDKKTEDTKEVEAPVKEEVKEDVVAEYTADANASVINFVGSKVGEDDSHNGTVKISEGTFTTTNGAVTAGTFVIDMMSIDAGMPKLNGHLMAEDIMNAATFPTSTFTITEGTDGEVKGTLSVIGAELPVTMTVTSSEVDGVVTWNGKGSVDFVGTDASTLQHEEGAAKYINSVIALDITLVGAKK
jgi:polyisoprenoid-binding protein YceI